MRLYKVVLLIAIIIIPSVAWANDSEIHFRQISPPGGFTHTGITSIEQDKSGHMWFGCSQGLIMYNSTATKWFVSHPNDSTTLPNSKINDTHLDFHNKLWVASPQGLCKFNRRFQNFEQVHYVYEDHSLAIKNVSKVISNKAGHLYILDSKYFGLLNLETKVFNRIGKDLIKAPRTLYRDSYNHYWIGTKSGEVYHYKPNKAELTKVVEAKGCKVTCLLATNDQIWVGYEKIGAIRYDRSGKQLHHFSFDPNQSVGNVRSIKKDTAGRLWFATYEGLFMYDGSEIVKISKEEPAGLTHNSIFQIFEDHQGGIWVSTWHGGVFYYHHSDNAFQTYRHSSENSISNNSISSFLQTSEEQILIGTELGGLNSFNLRTGNFALVPVTDNHNTNIKCLCKDTEGGIWVGTYKKGLFYKAHNASHYKHITGNPEHNTDISESAIYSMYATDSGLWIGTFGEGLFYYDLKSQKLTRSNHNSGIHHLIRTLFVDSKSNLWIGTQFGFYKIDTENDKLTRYLNYDYFNKNNTFQAYCFFENENGEIWVGGNNSGIVIYDPIQDAFRAFSANSLLKDKDVYGIIKDKNGQLWITSNNGLIKHNWETNESRQFLYQDGIQSMLFNPQAVFADKNKRLYFGGANGFTIISPDHIKINNLKSKVFVNQLVTTDNKSIYIDVNTPDEKIHLKANENTFRLSFSTNNYLLPWKNKYEYRLINYYDEWIDNGNSNSALFTNLDDGEYIFEIRACNNDGIWSNTPTRLTIIIENHWYKSTLAYTAYSLFVLSLILIFLKLYTERIKLKQDVKAEQLHRKHEEDIHDMKIKFYTNVSHEFRTPLTLISWPLKQLLKAENISEEQRKGLEIIDRNSQRLLNLINQIIDFRKIDKGKEKLNLSQFDIIDFIVSLQKTFSLQSSVKNVSFILDCRYTSLLIEADKEKIETILYNFLSNAYKYTPENGTINVAINNTTLHYNTEDTDTVCFGSIDAEDLIEITIENSGPGIYKEDLLKIFNRFECGLQNSSHDQKAKSSGIGLSICKDYTLMHSGRIMASSSRDENTVFSIAIPRTQGIPSEIFEDHKESKNLKQYKTHAAESNIEIYKNSKLLLVEDNIELRELLSHFLSQYFHVSVATNGKQGLSTLETHDIDLIISDVMMPEMDGIEFCNRVKTQIESSHIPVILLTALSSSENLVSGLENGADAYITKPFEEKVLLSHIENILSQRRRIWQNFSSRFIQNKASSSSHLDNTFLDKVKTAIENNIQNEKFGIDPLAEELAISRSQLHRKIKALSGMSTSEFVNLVRIQKAVELIKSEQYQYNEIAFMVGFSNQSYFSQCFKKVHGLSPKEFFKKT